MIFLTTNANLTAIDELKLVTQVTLPCGNIFSTIVQELDVGNILLSIFQRFSFIEQYVYSEKNEK